MQTEVLITAAAIPGSLFILSSIGGQTAQMTNNDPKAVKMALAGTAATMLIAAAATGSVPTVFTTAVSIVVVFAIMRNVWDTPSLEEATEVFTG